MRPFSSQRWWRIVCQAVQARTPMVAVSAMMYVSSDARSVQVSVTDKPLTASHCTSVGVRHWFCRPSYSVRRACTG